MRARTKVTCFVLSGLGLGTAGALANGCVSNSNAPSIDGGSFDSTSPTEDTGISQGDTGHPAPPADAGSDAPVFITDAGADTGADAGTDAGTDAGCAPATLTAWTPPAYVHAKGAIQFLCQPNGVVDEFWNDCLGDAATTATCATYDAGPGETSCASCLLSPEDASTYGASVVRVVPQTNLAGCIELGDPSDAGYSCAVAIQAAQACVEASCRPSCPVTSDPATTQAYTTCTLAAATTTCATYASAARTCTLAEADAGVSQLNNSCFSATDPEALFDSVGLFFCGS